MRQSEPTLVSDLVFSGAHLVQLAAGADLTPTRWAKPARLARMDRLCGLALVAADGALADAVAAESWLASWASDRAAVVFGSAYGCHATNEDYYRGLLAHSPSPRLFAYTLPSSPVGEISIHYGLRGPALALCTGLTAGLDALATAATLLRERRADRVLVCAAEVATPLLARLLPRSEELVDAAACVVLERRDALVARAGRPRGRLLACEAAFAPAAPELAADDAIGRALNAAHHRPKDLQRRWCDATLAARRSDAHAAPEPARSEKGCAAAPPPGANDSPDLAPSAGALAAAPLIALARYLKEECGPLTLLAAGDPFGSATAALVGG